MPIFGDQYYLQLYTEACSGLSKEGSDARSHWDGVFDKMWKLHCLKGRILTLDQDSQNEEKSRISATIRNNKGNQTEALEFLHKMMGIKATTQMRPQWLKNLFSLYRRVEGANHSELLTPELATLIFSMEKQLEVKKHEKKWKKEITQGNKILSRIKAKGYSWNFKRKIQIQPPPGGYDDREGGLPRNLVTSGWETNRRRH